MKIAKGLINLDKEFEAVVNFVKLRWKTGENVENILRKAWDKGIVSYKDQSLSLCAEKFSNYLSNPELFKDFLYELDDKYSETFSYYHPYKVFMRNFKMIGNDTFFNERNVSFDGIEDYMLSILKEYPEYKKMKPVIKPNENDYYKLTDAKDFKGVEVQGISPVYVIFPYDIYIAGEYEGKDKAIGLLMSVLRHAMHCQQHNNSIIMKREIEKVDNYFRSFDTKIPFNVSFKNVTKNKFLLDVLKKSEKDFISEEEFEYKRNSIDKYEILSLEEKVNREENVRVEISNMWDDILNGK